MSSNESQKNSTDTLMKVTHHSRFYTDGVLSATGSNLIQSETVGVLRIGSFKKTFPSISWNGSIDEVSVFNRALNSTKAKQLYNMGK